MQEHLLALLPIITAKLAILFEEVQKHERCTN